MIVPFALLVDMMSRRWTIGVVLAAVLLVILLGRFGRENEIDRRAQRTTSALEPVPQVADHEFVSSQACRECHPAEFDTWHDTFHRTMTQIVSPQTMLAPLDEETTLVWRDEDYRFWREGDEYWVDMVDPDWAVGLKRTPPGDPPPHVRRQLVMSTGSHHFQTFWVKSDFGNQLFQVPWVYHLHAQQWMPADDAFVSPPDGPKRLAFWNMVCIQCHAVGGQPGEDPEEFIFTSQVAELGIACEACHGPGRKHVERHAADQDAQPGETPGEEWIVNPASLSHKAASQICGQCHSYFTPREEDFLQNGFAYRAGEDLHETRIVHSYEDDAVQADSGHRVGFWRDGAVRVAGREFTGMDDSACYRRGELSCLSCHSMHNSDPDGQLANGRAGNEACLACHTSFRDRVAQHTRHREGSAGSLCYNCHMPHTSYGLLQAVRSHRIDSPTAEMTLKGRPNACNLCHLDRTLQWTADRLTEWYAQPAVEVDQESTSSGVSLLLSGDAVQRAVMAWSFGWAPAHAAAGNDWQPPLLALLLDDPYSSVRFTAYRALREYPGFTTFEYDFLAPQPQRAEAVRRAIAHWQPPVSEEWPAAIPLDSSGTLDWTIVDKLRRLRDDTPIALPE